MIFIIAIILIVVLLLFFKQSLEKNKYRNIVYVNHLKEATQFIDHIQSLDDYVTWVQRDQIKSKYSNVRQYFKNKTKFYKKEDNVKKFNEYFSDFHNYIVRYNQNYVNGQKEKLSLLLWIVGCIFKLQKL